MAINIRRVLLIYAIELALLTIVSIIGFYAGPYFVSESLIKLLQGRLTSTLKYGPMGIFLHNLMINTLMTIPIIGPFFFVFSLASTGFVLGTFVAYDINSILGLVMALLITMFFPHGIIELMAYAFSTTGSITLTEGIFRRRVSRGDVVTWMIYYAISVVLLFIAANVEYFEIVALRGLIRSLLT